MKGEDQILELLAEVLRRQDKTQEMNVRLGHVEENQVAHQQILRTLTLGQQKHQRELEGILDMLDSVARMQRDTNRRRDRLEHPGDFA